VVAGQDLANAEGTPRQAPPEAMTAALARTLEAALAPPISREPLRDDLDAWRQIVSRNLSLLDEEGRRLALDALGAQMRV
jgi:hypothetical protein